ncbi:hypothetical protein [Hymenobacter psoromatis]|uniref:hypothetical protein n=1 Tax=Hymenobacter psoromatis TaxID=1484116 RepID=UPI001CBD1B87|nr:hypothetical protein [Hymenobacter psoromatis]
MKSLLILVLLLVSNLAYSQTIPYLRAIFLNPNVYYTKVDLKLTQFSDDDGKLLDVPKEVVLKPTSGLTIRYKIAGIDGDYTIIELLPIVKINSDNTITAEDPSNEDDNAANYVYYIKSKDFGLNQKIILSEKIVGTPLIFPYKLRLQDKGDGASITTDFTVGYTFGLRLKTSSIPYKQNFFTIIPYGFGLGSTKYFYQKSDGTYSDKKDGVAITYYTGGLLWTINKVNVGLFAGRDAMIDKQNNWAYQGKWWLSFGLGYKFKTD